MKKKIILSAFVIASLSLFNSNELSATNGIETIGGNGNDGGGTYDPNIIPDAKNRFLMKGCKVATGWYCDLRQ